MLWHVECNIKNNLWLESFTAGCENGCSRHGQCTLEDGEYKCVCIEGWAGSDCSLALEMKCDDNIDNDHGKYACKAYILATKCNKLLLNKRKLIIYWIRWTKYQVQFDFPNTRKLTIENYIFLFCRKVMTRMTQIYRISKSLKIKVCTENGVQCRLAWI